MKQFMHAQMTMLYIIISINLQQESLECHISRYRTDQVTKNVPRKFLRNIPVIPHLQQLFRRKNISQFMDYHAHNRSQYDILRIEVRMTFFECL